MSIVTRRLAAFSTAIILFAASSGALAQKKYDTGVTDTEIKIGNIMPRVGVLIGENTASVTYDMPVLAGI